MQSSSQASKPRRFDASRRNISQAGSKVHGSSFQREDKNMNTINKTSPRRITKAPPAPSMIRPGVQPRAPAIQSRLSSQKQVSNVSRGAKPKPKSARATTVVPAAAKAAPPPPLPSVLPLDPNCNEPSLPCLCCDGRSPQDNNSMFNHNHNNNNTISLRQQMQLPPPPGPLAPVQDGKRAKEQVPSEAKAHKEPPANLEKAAEKAGEGADVDNKKKVEEDDDDESSGDVAIDEADSDDDDDDDTLVPSCCDCPPSLLEFSLSSSSSSYSTSISSCSDLDSDCADQSASICSSHDQDNLFIALDPREHCLDPVPEFQLSARSPPSLSLNKNPFSRASRSPSADYSPDEGYPSALDSPSPDFLGLKGDSEVNKLGLLDFLESVGEFGKMERFSQVIQVAHWDLEGEQHWDVLRDRLDHLDRLEKVNREVKLAYIARLHEKGLDLGDLEEQDLTDVMDEMGNIDIPWKLYKSQSGTLRDSQEFSDAGVDLTAPSDCDDPLVPDSPSPEEPPPRPPKPPARHASVTSDLHTYIHISRESSSTGVTASPTLVTFSPNSSSPTFTTFRCEKPPPSSPPSVPPLPASKPVSYLTLYTAPSPPPPIAALIPPIPPPRKRHLARKEAQRLAALQAEQEMTPVSLPPPTTRPPPLPPPPVISVTSSSSPPASPHPPTLPPPPSFHTLDVEIRKLLMLAGLTQAELLKLSPELGVCVGGLEEKEADNLVTSRSLESREFRLQDGGEESEPGAGQCDGTANTVEGGEKEDENSSAQRTTSFTEMARRRKRNTSLMADHYYSSSFSNSHKAMSIEAFQRPKELPPSSPPPPPPPRPLPPIPPSLSPPKASTLPANSEQPERFDWLIAFTPEAPPQLSAAEKRKSHTETPKKPTSSGSPARSGPRVTTFKELRFRNKSASPPTKVITEPEPDPAIVTPDPDILYNLKWRREKAGSDGSQWEYTSQAQALLMQPPPALTSMAALQEMLQRADAEGRQPELCPSREICDSSLWSTGKEEERGEVQPEVKEEETVEVRGQADGGRTLESRTTVSSPPLPLAQSSQPYFLHPALPSFRPGYCSSQPLADLGSQRRVGEDKHFGKHWSPAASSARLHGDDSSSGLSDSLVDLGVGSPRCYEDIFKRSTQSANRSFTDSRANKGELVSDSVCNLDSLYSSDSGSPLAGCDPVFSGTTGGPGCSTPYKNIDVMMTYLDSIGAVDSLYSERSSHADRNLYKARTHKELPPLPTYYLYSPKNCPLHRGSPPRLSPIGALSPPQRSGAPCSHLNSPLFPRSHTLPALAAPLYYPNLYPPIPPRPPHLPPKLYQGPLQPHVATVRSVLFAGSVRRSDAPWMGEDAERPVRGLTSLCLQEKKALIGAVGAAVEAILAQFSSSRTIVQKALSGDSAVNPSLGRLVLQCLCPALHNLLTDGLKPHQSDLIAGRRPNSAWGLVQATARPGPKTQALFNLRVRVGELPQLERSKHRFNTFLLGLLNTKLLDFWLSHLQSCCDVLEACYHPSSFMRLSLTACRPQYEELLLVLQPLSLLTFNLDLLFQHHHLEPDAQRPGVLSSPLQEAGRQPDTRGQPNITGSRYTESLSEVDFGSPEHPEATKSSADPKVGGREGCAHPDAEPGKASFTLGQTSPQLLWVQEKDIGGLPPPDAEEDSFTQQAGQAIQQGWGAVMRWGGRLGHNLSAGRREEAQTGSDYAPVSGGTPVPWSLGRLFGASKSPNSPAGLTPPTRRPSQWLAPGVTALTRMVSSSSAPILRRIPEPIGRNKSDSEKDTDTLEMKDKPKPLRSVRTLCHHTGTGSELSFCKGEELVVLGGVDQDWIRCRQGNKEGLVPIGYTSLIM
ncbi:uncharacterized protein rusc1 isoform X1 [Nothobranchius furzeri]